MDIVDRDELVDSALAFAMISSHTQQNELSKILTTDYYETVGTVSESGRSYCLSSPPCTHVFTTRLTRHTLSLSHSLNFFSTLLVLQVSISESSVDRSAC